MVIFTLVMGIIFIIFSIVSISGFFSKNEWRAPLLELSSELKGGVWKKIQPGVRRRGLSLVIFFLVLFSIGGVIILQSSIWLLKGVYELIRTLYSRKTRLLNYLFSPYLFAWRRDHLSAYSDQEIASAICRVCNIQDNSIIQENMNLKDFLIALHRKTRPSREHNEYPEILKENIAQAEQMICI
jgi:hypothetical protein